ncbi:MAG: heavy metal-binding domain-containing protein [Bacteroidota bacterium]
MKQNYLLIIIAIVALFGLRSLSVAQEHNHQKPEQQKAKPQDQSKDVYTCPMHPDVVSDKPGKCPQCGMKLEKKKSVSDQEEKMAKMMGKPMYELFTEGLEVQVWLITQDEHKEMMAKRMKDGKGDMGGMKHDMMQGSKDSTKAGMMHHDMMGKESKHDMKEGEPLTMMKGMMEGTHHVMVRVLEEKTKKAVTGANVQFVATAPSGKTSTVNLVGMMDHFGGGVAIEEKGEHTMTVAVQSGEDGYKVQFTYKQD